MRVSTAIEKCGIPTTSIVISGFMAQGKLVAKSEGIENMSMSEYTGTMMTDSSKELVRKVDTIVVNNVIRGLTSMPMNEEGEREEVVAEPNPHDIIFKGDFRQVNNYFHKQLWTDGLPIVPPTTREVEKFLSFTHRSPQDVIAILPHENREATAWNIAVNGVMAGCRPEYMPILVAVVTAISETGNPNDPRNGGFRVQDAGTTPGWEPLIVINGPIIKDLDFNYGQGVMRFGRQSNTSIGRFLKLFMRNICGFRIPPGVGDKGSIAQSMNVVLAENEDIVKELGWNPYSVDRGFTAGENTVTVLSSVAISVPVFSSGDSALQHMETIAEVIGRRTWKLWAIFSVLTLRFEPLLLLGPAVAKILVKDGWTKADIKEYLFKNVRTTAIEIQKQAMDFNGIYLDLCDRVARGLLPPEYCECTDVERPVKVFPDPESIQIVVSGDPSRNQSKGFIQNGYIGAPVTKKIELPDNWQLRLREET